MSDYWPTHVAVPQATQHTAFDTLLFLALTVEQSDWLRTRLKRRLARTSLAVPLAIAGIKAASRMILVYKAPSFPSLFVIEIPFTNTYMRAFPSHTGTFQGQSSGA